MKRNRILSVTLKNIKNVANGTIEFEENDEVERGHFEDKKCGILGIYGQNGSGKTTVINVFNLLKTLSLGRGLNVFDEHHVRRPSEFDYLLSLTEKTGSVIFDFLIYEKNDPYKVEYEITLERKKAETPTAIKKESFTVYPYHENGTAFKLPLAPLTVDYTQDHILYLYDGVKHEPGYQNTPSKKEALDQLTKLSAKKLDCIQNGSSLVFSDEVAKYLSASTDEEVARFGKVLAATRFQIEFELFVYADRNDALSGVGLGTILGVYVNKKNHSETHGCFELSAKPFQIETKMRPLYDQFMNEVNTFISSFVPSFEVYISLLSTETKPDGSEYQNIAIFRRIGEGGLPLSQESAGIRKLFNIACALIYVYGNPSAWLAVDELDSGVFENLLGQILQALEERGKGQLLFTAHNLTPLERISSKHIVFTTDNPKNRYLFFKKVAPTNNLRDLYIRALKLGGQDEELSTPVDVDDIEMAMWNAYNSLRSIEGEKNGK
jgi:AAA15 family ATPase/GTPase